MQLRYRWGPREVDLDIIFYDNLVYESDDRTLTIPHPRVHERDFVLGPMCDLSPGTCLILASLTHSPLTHTLVPTSP
jgi:7,8-dihydro-6-hydroxymethylpterin-pyrophosphokinase